MRVLLLHSDIPVDAPPDELDTLVTAATVAQALRARGHAVVSAAFDANPSTVDRVLAESGADIVFNLVESVFGQGSLAGLAPAMLERRCEPFTGASSAAIGCCADKPFAKRILRMAQLPTPDWAEPPNWDGIADDRFYVVKSATEDCSIGLDDNSVVRSADAVRARAAEAAARHGGSWFAEAYCHGREFNVSLLETASAPHVLPIGEIIFSNWQSDRPRLVGYTAKWDAQSADSVATPRVFGIENQLPELAAKLAELSTNAWNLFGLRGYARVDFRLDSAGEPTILEINPNPCLEPEAGFAAAAEKSGMSYDELVERILLSAVRN